MLTITGDERSFECCAPNYRLHVDSEGFGLDWSTRAITFNWDCEMTGTATVGPVPDHAPLWGPGRSLSLPMRWSEQLAGSIRMSLYRAPQGLVVSGQVQAPSQVTALDRLPLFSWTVAAEEADACRMLISSGHQGYCGSVPLRHRLSDLSLSQDVTVLRQPGTALALGNVSLRRTNLWFERALEHDGSVTVRAFLAYGGMHLTPDRPLLLESVLILPGQNSLAVLEAYADSVVDTVRPCFSRSRVGLYNQWYANWTPTSDHGSAELTLEGAALLKDSSLLDYGVSILGSGVWQNRGAFGEEEPWPGLFPQGIKTLRDQLQAKGVDLMHGGFWSKASACATVFREHPEWMARNDLGEPALVEEESWGACPFPYYVPDVTLPEVQSWLRHQWERIREASTGYYWLDFFGTGTGIDLDTSLPKPLRFSDATVSYPFETDRLNAQIIRETVGDDAIIGVYTSPTFNLIGLIDRARVAMDCGSLDPPTGAQTADPGVGNLIGTPDADARWSHVQAVARNLAANYFCHDRFWINDPDPAMVGLFDRPETLEEARVRLMLAANSGGFITVGEALDKMHPRRLALLKLILPPYGVAARPLDLLDSDVPQVHDLLVQAEWDSWHVVTCFNWDDATKTYTIAPDSLGLGGAHHVHELWDRMYLGVVDGAFDAVVPARSCRVFCLRRVRPYPWPLATDLHMTQGGVELGNVRWHSGRKTLTGTAFRPDGRGSLLFTFPQGFAFREAIMADRIVQSSLLAPGVRAVAVQFEGAQVRWEIRVD